MLKTISLIFILLFCKHLLSQEISGTIKNPDGKPVPYSTIYIEELQTGTSANQEGKYNLRVTKGAYTISYRALGYGPVIKNIEVNNSNIILDIELPFQSYILAGVTVRADGEDPAYAIMRKAISRVPAFINQVESFSSEVYIKGSAIASKIPKILAKNMEVNGEQPVEGQTYVNESINIIRFKAPDSYEQEVISVNNSFPIDEDDIPVIGLMSGSIYESQEDLYISPFSPNAFAHYKFKYEGLLQDGAWFIDKIKVIPKRKSKLLMSGYLYIVEDLWCLYSYDIKLNPPYTALEIKQHYAPVKGNNYLPVSMFVKAKISVMGVKANATYTTTIKYKDVIINPLFAQNKIKQAIVYNPTLEEPEEKEEVTNPKVIEIDQKLDELYKKDDLSNREMNEMQKLMSKKASLLKDENKADPLEILTNYNQIIKKGVLVRDSTYWDSVRPVPASKEEKISYKKVEEKIEQEKKKPFYKKFFSTLAFGNYEWERKKTFHAFYPGLIAPRNIRFHPVDGLMLNQSFKLRYKIDNNHILRTKGMLGYAFDRESIYGKGQLSFWYMPKRMGFAELNYGYQSTDFNSSNDKLDAINSLYTLLYKQNYIKKYHATYITGKTNFEISNGLVFGANAEFRIADSLTNNTNFSLLFPNKSYESNTPINDEIDKNSFNLVKKLGLSLSLSYTPKQFYSHNKSGKKRSHGSNWPTFTGRFSTALKLNNNYEEYYSLGFGVRQKIDIYSVATFKYYINSGITLASSNVHFSSFKHFRTIQEPFAVRGFENSIFLLNSYEYSTKKKYLQSHFKYTNQFILLKRLPIISNQLWDENIYTSILLVENRKPYFEAGYTLGRVLFEGEVGVFAAFKGTDFHGVGIRGRFRF